MEKLKTKYLGDIEIRELTVGDMLDLTKAGLEELDQVIFLFCRITNYTEEKLRKLPIKAIQEISDIVAKLEL